MGGSALFEQLEATVLPALLCAAASDDGTGTFDAQRLRSIYGAATSTLFRHLLDACASAWGVDRDASLSAASVPRAESQVAALVRSLLSGATSPGEGRLELMSLDVRHLGELHERLLAHEAAHLGGALRLVRRSGARKAAGAFFTPEFVIEHVLEHVLEPALREHLARLDARHPAAVTLAELLDFRVIDPAMGAGYFLVAAARRIECAIAQYLSRRELPGVRAELGRAGREDGIGGAELRRAIASHCIFGVDVDLVAVGISRLAVALHGGVTRAALEHALLYGDALLGSTTADEGLRPGLAADELDGGAVHFARAFPEVFSRSRSGFDVVLGNPPWEEVTLERDRYFGPHLPKLRGLRQGERDRRLTRLRRERADLDDAFRRELLEHRATRRALLAANFPGMGTGDPDLYKAFAWRFWQLAAPRGFVGIVLPRSALQSKGSAAFRRELLARAEVVDLTLLANRGSWAFEEVEPRYTIALACLRKSEAPGEYIRLRGPYTSRAAFDARPRNEGATLARVEVLTWTDDAALPMLPSPESLAVFRVLRRAPRLDADIPGEWRVRPYREFDATNDKRRSGSGLIDLRCRRRPSGFWPVFGGESFDLWEPDRGIYYGFADPREALPELVRRAISGLRRPGSPFREFVDDAKRLASIASLPCMSPRIAFRDVTRATDSRTVRAALVPSRVFLTNKAPYLLWPRGDARDQAFLLGVLSSRCLDWYARRFVEVGLNYHVFNPLPIPRPRHGDPLWWRAVALAGRLACVHGGFAAFAEAVGVETGPLRPEEKASTIAELDAVVAHLYGLREVDLAHIFATFHEGWDHREELGRVQAFYREWTRRLSG